MDGARCPACGAAVAEYDPRCPACGADPGAVAPAGAAGELGPGQVLSHFRIVGPLGRGGMGTVYRAVDLELGREVALKFLHPEGAGADGPLRFAREARAVAALDHPNVATLYETGEHQGRPFLVMALYEGETLRRRLARGPLAVGEAGALAAQIAAALAAAHAAGLVHRDLKPDNLLLLPDGRLKLLDFGLARSRESTDLTQPGAVPGTLAYLAPEGLRGEAVGPPADVWALGVVLYEMLAGRHPFGGLEAQLLGDPAPLPPTVPAGLAALVAACLRQDSERRPPDGEAVARALAAAGFSAGRGGAVPVRPRRRPGLAAGVAAGALVLALAAGLAVLALSRPAPPLAVAALPAEVTSAGSAAANPAPSADDAVLRLNLQIAVLRALASLQGVSAFESEALRAVPAEPRAAARALAADQVVTARALCQGDLCQVVLQRLDGGSGAVLWTEGLSLPRSRPQLFAEATTAAVRRGFAERRPRRGAREAAVPEDDYRDFLALRERLTRNPGARAAGLAEVQALRRRAPDLLEAAFLEGSLCRYLFESTGDAGYLERGLAGMREAAARAPEDPRPSAVLFDLALAAGRLDEAAAALARLEQLDPGAAGVPLRQARLAERRGDLAEAARRLAVASARRPSWQLLLAAANMEYRLGHLAAARRALETLLARSPGHAEGTETLAQIELLAGDPRRALALLQGLRQRTASRQVAGNLGLAQLLLGRAGEAEATFRGLLAEQPGDPQIALNLADALALQGKRKAAERYYGEAAREPTGEAQPPSWGALSVRAQALAHLDRRQAAVAALERALRLTPDNPQLAFEASLVFTLLGDRSSARFHAERALAGGVSPRWFGFPWFATLRAEPGLADRLAGRPAS